MKKNYFIQLLTLTAVFVVTMVGVHKLLGLTVQSASWGVVAFFTGLNATLFFLGRHKSEVSNANFLYRTFGGMFLRVFLGLAFIAIYLITSEVNDKSVIIVFLLAYLFYLTFDKYYLVTKLRAEKIGNKENSSG